MAEPFVRERQARVCYDMIGIERGDAHPVFNGFLHFALLDIQIRGAHGRIHRALQVTQPLAKLGDAFHRNGIFGGKLRHAFINIQRLAEAGELMQRQPQVVERLGLVGGFLQGGAIRGRRLFPLLVPGGRMAVVHVFLESVFSSGHGSILHYNHFIPSGLGKLFD